MSQSRVSPILQRFIKIPYLVGVLFILFTGVSLLSRPDYEISYDPEVLAVPCHTMECIKILTLRVGNTGKKRQEQVRVSVRTAIIGQILHGPSVEDNAKVQRQPEISHDGDVTTYDIGSIVPGHRLDLIWLFSYPSGSDGPSWDNFLIKVESRAGKVQRAPPELTTFGRFLMQIGALF